MRTRTFVVFAFLTACADPPARHPTTMEGLPPPAPDEAQPMMVAQNGMKTLVVGEGVALRRGRTLLHVERPGKARVDVAVEVGPPDPNAFALAVGETLRLPAAGVKETSESGPGVVEITLEGTDFVVRARKPGTNVVLFVLTDGTSRSVELTVVGGERQL